MADDGRTIKESIGDEEETWHRAMINAAELFVKEKMSSYDSSHDYFHVDRVRKLALSLAKEENLSTKSCHIIELTALLHDVGDYKYATSNNFDSNAVEEFLVRNDYPKENMKIILNIIDQMGFKEELNGKSNLGQNQSQSQFVSPEFAVVQDADRLDAIGAIGIARCFSYGGSKGFLLHDPSIPFRKTLSKEEYQYKKGQSTSINHFYEKLLKLKDLMKSNAGKKRAITRHEFMIQFLNEFHMEWNGEA